MHFSAQEEYGLRCVLQLANNYGKEAITSRDISQSESISLDYVHKLLGILKRKGLIQSTRGVKGGFHLKKDPSLLTICEVLDLLCSELNSEGHCAKFKRKRELSCRKGKDCVVRPFWETVYSFYKYFGSRVTIQDLIDHKVPVVDMSKKILIS